MSISRMKNLAQEQADAWKVLEETMEQFNEALAGRVVLSEDEVADRVEAVEAARERFNEAAHQMKGIVNDLLEKSNG